MTSARILLDSVAPSGYRLTTFEAVMPRIVLAELNTHRAFSRNSASSRAIPSKRQLERVATNPFVPSEWGSNQRGMQAGEPLTPRGAMEARRIWLEARDHMMDAAEALASLGVHKQLANRLLEPFQYHTVIISATEYNNFFAQRCSPLAQPQIQDLAYAMYDAYAASTPQRLRSGELHLPLIQDDEREMWDRGSLIKISVARCARVSYLTHDGRRDAREDLALYEKLLTSGHYSPFEHVAVAMSTPIGSGNFTGFAQFRKTLPGENRTEFTPSNA